jgi:hypothetical protein
MHPDLRSGEVGERPRQQPALETGDVIQVSVQLRVGAPQTDRTIRDVGGLHEEVGEPGQLEQRMLGAVDRMIAGEQQHLLGATQAEDGHGDQRSRTLQESSGEPVPRAAPHLDDARLRQIQDFREETLGREILSRARVGATLLGPGHELDQANPIGSDALAGEVEEATGRRGRLEAAAGELSGDAGIPKMTQLPDVPHGQVQRLVAHRGDPQDGGEVLMRSASAITSAARRCPRSSVLMTRS